MNKIIIKINHLESPVALKSRLSLSASDVVIVETPEGISYGTVEEAIDSTKQGRRGPIREESFGILRKANLSDVEQIKESQKKEREALKTCRSEVKKNNLPMKIASAKYSFDGGNITIYFTADGRIDFRDLVKNLSKKFQRSIRMHQIGARDESRQQGGFGICGREQCCVKFKGNLPSITSDMAKVQKIAHRGAERISGICGRLMCCLAYEADQYRKMLEEMPQIGQTINYKGADVLVRDVDPMTGRIKIEHADKSIVSINHHEVR